MRLNLQEQLAAPLILQEGITIAEKSVREHLEAIGHKDAFEYVITPYRRKYSPYSAGY